jgi:hypothetical protein
MQVTTDTSFMRLHFFSALALCCGPALLWAQSAANSGQIMGQVLDPSGAFAAAVEVSARNTGTNYRRLTTTDAEGRYAVGSVPLGVYEVTVKSANLEASSQHVYVSLGGRATANFSLGLPLVRESIDVSSQAAGIEPGQTFSKSVLTDIQLRNLPSNGRRIRNMFLLMSSTQIEPECGGFAISGQKGLFTNINVDGGDYTNTHWCGHVEFSPSFSMESLQEFQVLRSTFSAEFGRSTGGIINLATKAGSNQYHGSGFYLFRNDDLTRKDPFGREQIGQGQQFGGSIGGPIAKDRTFFFSTAEFQHNTKLVQVLYSELDRQGIRNTSGARALLDVAPEDQLEALSQSQSVINRIDHRLTQNHYLMGRFDYIRNRVTDTAGPFIMTQGIGADSITNRSVQNASPINDRKDLTGMVQLTSVLSSRYINEFRVQRVREYRPWDPGTGPEVTVRHGNPVQTLAIYGPQATGLSYGNIGYRFTDTRYQFIDNFSVVTGAHTVKLGFDSNRVNGKTTFNPGWNGTYRFDSLQDYLDRRPAQYTQFAGTGALDATIHQIALYVQDEWRVRPGLTVSPGFRYEMALLPDYLTATVPQNRFPLATSIPDDKELIAPRLGLAWDVRKNARTMVRAAAGLFYAAPYMPLFEQAMLGNGGNPDLSSNVTLNGTATILNAFQSAGIDLSSVALNNLPVFTGSQLDRLAAPENRIAGQTVVFFDRNFRLPRAVHFRAALEQEITSGITAGIDYTHINVARIDRVRNLNLPVPAADATGRLIFRDVNTTKPFSRYGFAYVTEPSARSLYRGFTTTLNIRRKKFTADASYTLGWSYSHDDHERGISGAVYDNAFNLDNEYSYSNIDQRHQFAATGLFYMPFGFELSTSLRFNSGRPFSPTTGSDSNGDGILRDRPVVDGKVLRRNTYRNTGYSDVSARVQRYFTMANEKGRLSLTAEIFNLFGFDNVEIGSAQMTYGSGPLSNNPNFGLLRNPQTGAYFTDGTLRTSPFQVQLGLRFQF